MENQYVRETANNAPAFIDHRDGPAPSAGQSTHLRKTADQLFLPLSPSEPPPDRFPPDATVVAALHELSEANSCDVLAVRRPLVTETDEDLRISISNSSAHSPVDAQAIIVLREPQGDDADIERVIDILAEQFSKGLLSISDLVQSADAENGQHL